MEKSPSELRLLLVDPKRVELTPYNGVPHLLTPVVVETDKVVPLLKALIAEMFKRYRHLEQFGVRNISSYNAQTKEKMPYLVLVVDELADLMMTSSFDVEQSRAEWPTRKGHRHPFGHRHAATVSGCLD